MIYKVINRCNLGKPLLRVLKNFVREDIIDIDPDVAKEFLNSLNPNPHNSAIRERKITISDKPQYDLDIIVPVYNVEKYLRKCIDSVLKNKTKYKFRITIIDDGSTDGSGKIIDEYKDLDCVKIIHQENKGLSSARNAGLNCLDSRYVTFLDSDDFLTETAIEGWLDTAFKYDADIVQSGYNYVNVDGTLRRCTQAEECSNATIKQLHGYAWGKVLKSQLFTYVKFPEGYWYEDGVMRDLIYEIATKRYIKSGIAYNYRRNKKSISFGSIGKTKSIDSLWIMLQLYEDREILGIETNREYVEYILANIFLSYGRTKALGNDVLKNMFVVYTDFYNKNFLDFEIADEYLGILAKALATRDFSLFKLCGNFISL